jgi:hypothetical protein
MAVVAQLLLPDRRPPAWLRPGLCGGAILMIVVSSLPLAGGLHAH